LLIRVGLLGLFFSAGHVGAEEDREPSMRELVSFDVEGGGSVLVELDDDEPGIDRVARGDGLVGKASTTLGAARAAIRSILRAVSVPLRDLDLASVDEPAEVTVEFGVRLNAQAGRCWSRQRPRASSSHDAMGPGVAV
jgi:hypothetical protein